MENDPRTFRVLKQNLESLGAGDRGTLHREDAIGFLMKGMTGEGIRYDVAFADPPYRKNLAVELASLWLKSPFATIFGVEHEASETLPAGGDTRRYGDTSVTIFRT